MTNASESATGVTTDDLIIPPTDITATITDTITPTPTRPTTRVISPSLTPPLLARSHFNAHLHPRMRESPRPADVDAGDLGAADGIEL